MDYKLQVFKQYFRQRQGDSNYRFIVIDKHRSSYPANFVCTLPAKLNSGKRNVSAFSQLFGDKGPDLAITLLSNALKSEQDAEVKTEIEKRLKLLACPKEALTVKCSKCNKSFKPKKTRKYAHYLCNECVSARYAKKAMA